MEVGEILYLVRDCQLLKIRFYADRGSNLPINSFTNTDFLVLMHPLIILTVQGNTISITSNPHQKVPMRSYRYFSYSCPPDSMCTFYLLSTDSQIAAQS
jgi:hypothetical protein